MCGLCQAFFMTSSFIRGLPAKLCASYSASENVFLVCVQWLIFRDLADNMLAIFILSWKSAREQEIAPETWLLGHLYQHCSLNVAHASRLSQKWFKIEWDVLPGWVEYPLNYGSAEFVVIAYQSLSFAYTDYAFKHHHLTILPPDPCFLGKRAGVLVLICLLSVTAW